MENTLATNDLLTEEGQRAESARRHREHREWLKSFGLMLASLVLAVTVAAVLAVFAAEATVRL